MGLSEQQIEQAAQFLLAARGDHRAIEAFPPECNPQTVEEGYAIQERLGALWGLSQVGWKVGALGPVPQQAMGIGEPIFGRVWEPYLIEGTEAEVAASAFMMRGVECEFAFRLGADLPPRAGGYDLDAVRAAVASVHPAIEIVNTYWKTGLATKGPNVIADNGTNGGLMVGPAIAEWENQDLAAAEVVCTVDGEETGRGTGALVLGDPVNSLHWLANRASSLGYGLAAGQYVTTGTMTGCPFLAPGQTAIGDFGPYGTLTLTFMA